MVSYICILQTYSQFSLYVMSYTIFHQPALAGMAYKNNWQIKIKKFPSPWRGFYRQKGQQWSLIQACADNGFSDPATHKIALCGVKNHWAKSTRSTTHHTDVLPPVVTQVTTDVHQLGLQLLATYGCECFASWVHSSKQIPHVGQFPNPQWAWVSIGCVFISNSWVVIVECIGAHAIDWPVQWYNGTITLE